ncbi:MAG: T9SS type A sorting domain-containing protein [Balneolales bacterium]
MNSSKKLVLIGILVLSSGLLHAQDWVNTWGPDGGAILEMTEKDGKLYGRTSHNVYVSEDDGETWSAILTEGKLSNMSPNSLNATSFGIHVRATGLKIASSYDGETFEGTSAGFSDFENPSSISAMQDTLYAVVGANLFKSTDGAQTWENTGITGLAANGSLIIAGENIFSSSFSAGLKMLNRSSGSFETFGPAFSQNEAVSDIVKLGDKFVIVTNLGAWGINAEGEWEKTFARAGGMVSLGVVDGKIYGISSGTSILNPEAAIQTSADTGKTWTKVEVESELKPEFTTHNKIKGLGGKLYALTGIAHNPLVSADGGLNWEKLGTTGLKNPLTKGVFALNGDLFVTTAGGGGTAQYGTGIYKSSDAGDNWEKLDTGDESVFYTVRKNGGDLYATSFKGLHKSSDGGATWAVVAGTEEWLVSDIIFTDSNWIMAGGDGFSRVWVSTDEGATWEAKYEGIGAVFQTFIKSGDLISIGSNTSLIATSPDLGETWNFASGNGGAGIAALGDTLYSTYVQSTKIFKSVDAGVTWTEATGLAGLPSLFSFSRMFSKNNEEIYVIGTATVFEDGALVSKISMHKTSDGIHFEEAYTLDGLPAGFSELRPVFADDDFYMGINGATVFKYSSEPVGIANEEVEVKAEKFELAQNYPNPFNPSTNISFSLPAAGNVMLKVYNLLGQEVATLVNERMSAGTHMIAFNAGGLSSGTYIYRLQSGGNIQTRMMMLIK